jgi:hypothetical protein
MPPYLVEDDGEYRLDVAVMTGGRRQFALSDRAVGLLVDDLEYGNRDLIPWVTARTLVLTGGAHRRDESVDARAASWAITGADGGREPNPAELDRLGQYLDRVEVADHAVDTVRELVRSTQLSAVIAPTDVQSDRERRQGLRDIAKDL